MSHRPNAKSLKKGQFVWNATLNSKWGKIWKSRKLGLIGCQQEGGRPRCSLWHFDNCRSTSLGSISTFFVHLFQFIFLYKKGKTPQLQDGASETVLSRYVKRPIQRNYTSHLSIPPNHQAPYSTIQGVTKNLIKPKICKTMRVQEHNAKGWSSNGLYCWSTPWIPSCVRGICQCLALSLWLPGITPHRFTVGLIVYEEAREHCTVELGYLPDHILCWDLV